MKFEKNISGFEVLHLSVLKSSKKQPQTSPILIEKAVYLDVSLRRKGLFTFLYSYTGGPKVSGHTSGLIPPLCFILEGYCFVDGILYLLVRGSRRQNFKIRIS